MMQKVTTGAPACSASSFTIKAALILVLRFFSGFSRFGAGNSFLIICSPWLLAADFSQQDLHEETVIAANWQQYAAEYDALFYQAYNMARDNLTVALKNLPEGKKPAIIADIDDTLLEGVTYFTSLLGTDDSRTTERSIHWWNNQTAVALPGAVNFFQLAHSMGVEIFYISGRFDEVKPSTYHNLKSLGFPVSGMDNILLQGTCNKVLSKEDKRQSIKDRDYQVIMLFGDQLDDLAEVQGDSFHEKRTWVARNRKMFAREWYIFPNVIYGSWENALAQGYSEMTPEEKHQARLTALSQSASPILSQIDDPVYARHLTLASVWHHTSADYHALTLQAYNHAETLLEKHPDSSQKPAIIIDIDGTILDTAPVITSLVVHGKAFDPEKRNQWVLQQQAQAIPGALSFLNNASKRGYDIFYVSDRPLTSGQANQKRDIEKATAASLQQLGFPDADPLHILLKEEYCPDGQSRCGKEFKRKAITKGQVDGIKHPVHMHIGDLLTDFDLVEQGLIPGSREDTASVREQFGRHYIILPNPTQPKWMTRMHSKAAGVDADSLTQEEQAQIRRQLVRDWPDKPRTRSK